MAASLLALVRGTIIIVQEVIAAVLCKLAYLLAYLLETLAHGVVLHAPFGKQVSVSGEDYLCVAELCVS